VTTPARVLVIDDSDDTWEMYAVMLRLEGLRRRGSA
jgi:hypothetical protein